MAFDKYAGQFTLSTIFSLIKDKFSNLSKVATSGDYADLTNKPIFRKSTVVMSESSSDITIPITLTDSSVMLVFHSGILLVQDTHYTISGTKIVLKDYTANPGDVITFVIFS